MATNIELFIFGNDGTHGISHVEIIDNKLIVDFIAWNDKNLHKKVEFKNLEEMSIDAKGLDENDMPFDVIGIDAVSISSSKWQFCIHCAEVEYFFKSEWPIIT